MTRAGVCTCGSADRTSSRYRHPHLLWCPIRQLPDPLVYARWLAGLPPESEAEVTEHLRFTHETRE